MSYLSTTIKRARYLVNRDTDQVLVLEKNNGGFVDIVFDTPQARDVAISTAVNNLIAGSPGALDTLNELATALGDDANFAATVTTSLGNRLAWRGAWAATTAYVRNDLVLFNGGLYVAPASFTSGGSFVKGNWVELVPQNDTYALRTGVWVPWTLAAQASGKSIYEAQNPQSEYDATSDTTFVVYLGPGRDCYATSYNHTTGKVAAPVKIGTYPIGIEDDHGVPSLCIDGSGFIHVVWGAHGTTLKYSKSTTARSIAAWTTKDLSSMPPATYASLTWDSVGNALYVGYRTGLSHTGTYPTHEMATLIRSTDGGTTWSDLGPVIDTTLYNADAAHDAYIQDVDAVGGKVYVTWFVAHGTAHDGQRSDVFCAYYNPATSHMHTVDGTDRGTAIDTLAKLQAARVESANWVNCLKHVITANGDVYISWSEAVDSGAAATNTTLSSPASAGNTTVNLNASVAAGSRLVVDTAGNAETLYVLGAVTGSGPYVATISAGAIPKVVGSHATGTAVVATPQAIATKVAHWNGAAWTIVDTGARSHHLYHTPFLRQTTDNKFELFVITGRADETIWVAPLVETPVYANFGADLSVFTSPDGATWTDGGVILPRAQIAAQGVGQLGVPRNSDDGLKVLVAPAALEGVAGVGGAASWRLPLLAMTDTKVNHGTVLANPNVVKPTILYFDRVTLRTTASVSALLGAWQTIDLTGMAPANCTAVLLRFDIIAGGTAGRASVRVRENGTSITTAADFYSWGGFTGGATNDMFGELWCPLGPRRKFDWMPEGVSGSWSTLQIGMIAFRCE